MRYRLTIMAILIFTSMVLGQRSKDSVLVNNFVKDLTNDSIKAEDMLDYLSIGEKELNANEGQLREVVNMNLMSLQKKLNSCNGNYIIEPHFSLDEDIWEKYKYHYEKLNDVHHILCDEHIITSIIVEGGKIISFFTYLRKTEDQKVVPWILN